MSDSVRPLRRQPTRFPHPWDSPGKNTGVGCHFLLQCMKVKSESEVAQSCPTLSDPIDCSLPGSSIHGIFQTRVLEWGAIAFSGPEGWGSSIPPLPSFSLQFGRFGAILGMEGDSLQYKMACVDNVYVCDTHLFYYLQMSENAVLSPGK